jgi:ribosomal protein L11 methylase PrmA
MTTTTTQAKGPRAVASFRDPSGFVFHRDGAVFRQVNDSYREDFGLLVGSGLYARLAADGLLVPHEEVDEPPPEPARAYKVLRPEPIPFISYPYEWCFGQHKAAALLTLEVQRRAVAAGMTLKDCNAYNVQFRGGRPVLIDTLSFEAYREGDPWVAYRQFCQHFLAPLALMGMTDVRLSQLSRTNIDGVPLDLAGRLLPWRSRLRPSLALHVHLHARFQASYADAGAATDAGAGSPRTSGRRFARRALLGLVDHLEAAVRRLSWEPGASAWSGYYRDNSYDDAAMGHKERVVAAYLDRAGPKSAWDLGANTGRFSRSAASRGTATVAFDSDPACVELNYREVVRSGEPGLLPLLLDLTNPSPATGWLNRERASLLERGPADLVLALALVHHLAIANNLPLASVVEFFRRVGRRAIVEFVPKDDPQVARLLASRKDVFPDYHRHEFERCLRSSFEIEDSEPLPGSGRILYLLRGR